MDFRGYNRYGSDAGTTAKPLSALAIGASPIRVRLPSWIMFCPYTAYGEMLLLGELELNRNGPSRASQQQADLVGMRNCDISIIAPVHESERRVDVRGDVLNHGRKATDDAARRQIHGLDGVACLGEYELIFRPRRPARRSRPPPKGMPSGLSFANTPYIWCDSTVVVPRMVLYTSNWLDEAFVAVTTSIFSVMPVMGNAIPSAGTCSFAPGG